MKKTARKLFASVLAMAMTLSMVAPAFASADDSNSGKLDGEGNLQGRVGKAIVSAVFPTSTTEDNRYDFTLDPQGLIQATYAERYGLAPIIDTTTNHDGKMFFQRALGTVKLPVNQYEVKNEWSSDFIVSKQTVVDLTNATAGQDDSMPGISPTSGPMTDSINWNAKDSSIVTPAAGSTSAGVLKDSIQDPIIIAVDTAVKGAITGNTEFSALNTAENIIDTTTIDSDTVGDGTSTTWATSYGTTGANFDAAGFPTTAKYYADWSEDHGTAAHNEFATATVVYGDVAAEDQVLEYTVKLELDSTGNAKSGGGNWYQLHTNYGGTTSPYDGSIETYYLQAGTNDATAFTTLAAKAAGMIEKAAADAEISVAASDFTAFDADITSTTTATIDLINADTNEVAAGTAGKVATVTITKNPTVIYNKTPQKVKIEFDSDFLANSSPYRKYAVAAWEGNNQTQYYAWNQIEANNDAMKQTYKADLLDNVVTYGSAKDNANTNYKETVKSTSAGNFLVTVFDDSAASKDVIVTRTYTKGAQCVMTTMAQAATGIDADNKVTATPANYQLPAKDEKDVKNSILQYVLDNQETGAGYTASNVVATATESGGTITAEVKDIPATGTAKTLMKWTTTIPTGTSAVDAEDEIDAADTGLIKRDLDGNKYYTFSYDYTVGTGDTAKTAKGEVDLTALEEEQFVPIAKAIAEKTFSGDDYAKIDSAEVKSAADGSTYAAYTLTAAKTTAGTSTVQVQFKDDTPAAVGTPITFKYKADAKAYIWSTESDKLTVTNVGTTDIDVKVSVTPAMVDGLSLAVETKTTDSTTGVVTTTSAQDNLTAATKDPTIMLAVSIGATKSYNKTTNAWTSVSNLGGDLTSATAATEFNGRVASSGEKAYETKWNAQENKYKFDFTKEGQDEYKYVNYLLDPTDANYAGATDPAVAAAAQGVTYVPLFGKMEVSFTGNCNPYDTTTDLRDAWDELSKTTVKPTVEVTWEYEEHPTDTAPTMNTSPAITAVAGKAISLPIDLGAGDYALKEITEAKLTATGKDPVDLLALGMDKTTGSISKKVSDADIVAAIKAIGDSATLTVKFTCKTNISLDYSTSPATVNAVDATHTAGGTLTGTVSIK